MSISKKLKWRRALSSLRYLNEEKAYVDAVAKEAAIEFEAFYRKYCAEKNINISELDRQHKERLKTLYGNHEITDSSTHDEPEINSIQNTAIAVHNQKTSEVAEEYQMNADDIAIHEAFSKLFKQIALLIHPDKIDKTLPHDEVKSRISMFLEARKALNDKKYFILLDIAEKFKVAAPKSYELQTRWMKRQCEQLQNEIKAQKNTYNYCFAEATTDEEKVILIKKFLHQLFRMSIQ
jgi:hypothetical protein